MREKCKIVSKLRLVDSPSGPDDLKATAKLAEGPKVPRSRYFLQTQ